jgi:hypothetical protein
MTILVYFTSHAWQGTGARAGTDGASGESGDPAGQEHPLALAYACQVSK